MRYITCMERCDPKQLLRDAGIRVTRKKTAVLDAIIEGGEPLCARELHSRLARIMSIDPVTVYRTLAILRDAGIVREVDGASGIQHYEMACRHNPEHPHFRCMRCMKIECLPSLRDDEAVALSSAAEGREVREVSITLTGLCADCLGKEP